MYSINVCVQLMYKYSFLIFYVFISTNLSPHRRKKEGIFSLFTRRKNLPIVIFPPWLIKLSRRQNFRIDRIRRRLKRKLRSRKCYPNKIITFLNSLKREKILKILFHAKYKEKIVHIVCYKQDCPTFQTVKILFKNISKYREII